MLLLVVIDRLFGVNFNKRPPTSRVETRDHPLRAWSLRARTVGGRLLKLTPKKPVKEEELTLKKGFIPERKGRNNPKKWKKGFFYHFLRM